MIRAWLKRNVGIPDLVDRLATIERELSPIEASLATINERVAELETHCAGLRAWVSGQLQSAGEEQASYIESMTGKLSRLDTMISIIESRVENEAEEARRCTMGLLRRIEDLHRRKVGDGTS